MESSGIPNRIQVSQSTYDLLKHEYIFEERGKMEIKGKGTMIAYLFKGRLFERTKSGNGVRRALAMTPPSSFQSLTPSQNNSTTDLGTVISIDSIPSETVTPNGRKSATIHC